VVNEKANEILKLESMPQLIQSQQTHQQLLNLNAFASNKPKV